MTTPAFTAEQIEKSMERAQHLIDHTPPFAHEPCVARAHSLTTLVAIIEHLQDAAKKWCDYSGELCDSGVRLVAEIEQLRAENEKLIEENAQRAVCHICRQGDPNAPTR